MPIEGSSDVEIDLQINEPAVIDELPANISTEIKELEETEVLQRRSGRADKGKPPERLIETMNKIITEQIEPRNFKEALPNVHAEEECNGARKKIIKEKSKLDFNIFT